MGDQMTTAQQHVFEARNVVLRQRKIIERLQAKGSDTTQAQITLRMFEGTLKLFEEHLRDMARARRVASYERL
jgi:hypothetical protein